MVRTSKEFYKELRQGYKSDLDWRVVSKTSIVPLKMTRLFMLGWVKKTNLKYFDNLRHYSIALGAFAEVMVTNHTGL